MTAGASPAPPLPEPVEAQSAGRARMSDAVRIALFVALMGAAFTFAIAMNLLVSVPYYYIGQPLYDVYAQSIVNGHFDVPARYLKREGHMAADGTGYLYYGLAPVLTRLPFLPFVDVPTKWIPPFSIWFWSVLGSAAWHRAFWLALVRGSGGVNCVGVGTSMVLALAVWFGTPGVILVGSYPVFNEPIAAAYALGGGFALFFAMAAFGKLKIEKALIGMAVMAGLTVHARPHLAVGMYVTIGLIALWLVFKGGWPRWRAAGTAMIILGLFGAALLAMNQIRFGDFKQTHGSLTHGAVEYSSIYWGIEDPNGRRARTYTQEGPFNVERFVPNAMLYFFAPPNSLGMDRIVDAMHRQHVRMMAPKDPLTMASSTSGLVFMWPLWCLLAIIGLRQRELWRMPNAPLLAAAVIGPFAMLCYLTVMLRYHIDLWPLLGLPALFGVAGLAHTLSEKPERRKVWALILIALALVTIFVCLHKMLNSRVQMTDVGEAWSAEYCLELTAKKGFDLARSREICSLDAQGNDLL